MKIIDLFTAHIQEILFPFKSLACESESTAIFGNCANYVFRSARGNLGLDLERYGYGCTDQADKVRDHFISDAAGVTGTGQGGSR